MTIDTFTDERLHAEDLQQMMPRVELLLNPDITSMDFARARASVTVTLHDGGILHERVERPLGIWDNPMPWLGWVEKFRDCGTRALPEGAVADLVRTVEHLEQLDDVSTLVGALAP